MVHIWVSESTRDRLMALREGHDTIDDVIRDLLKTEDDLKEL